MSRRPLPSVLLLAALLLSGLSAHAVPPPPTAETAPMPHPLQLSAEQQEKIFALLHAAAPARFRQMQTIASARIELRRPDLDADALHQAGMRLGKALGEMAVLRAATERQIFAVLTPEQQRIALANPRPPMPFANCPPHRFDLPAAEKFAGHGNRPPPHPHTPPQDED